MKKQYILVFVFILFQITQAQAQSQAEAQEHCCIEASKEERTQLIKKKDPMSNANMKKVLDKEIILFTNYLSQNLEYPERAEQIMLEGKMMVHIVYENGFDRIEITKSIDPEIDAMVLDNIREYVKNFDRDYPVAPRLSFELPINFHMQ